MTKKETQTIDQTLKVMLSDSELLSIGHTIADRIAEIGELENSMAAVNKEYKMKIAAAETARNLLSNIMRSKYEYRPVTCSVSLGDPDASHKTITRNDTGERVAVVAMTPEEMQWMLDLKLEPAEKDRELLARVESHLDEKKSEPSDDDLTMAVEIFRSENKVSVALLQKRLKVSFLRASQILSTLVDREAVTPANGDEPQRLVDGPEKKGKK